MNRVGVVLWVQCGTCAVDHARWFANSFEVIARSSRHTEAGSHDTATLKETVWKVDGHASSSLSVSVVQSCSCFLWYGCNTPMELFRDAIVLC